MFSRSEEISQTFWKEGSTKITCVVLLSQDHPVSAQQGAIEDSPRHWHCNRASQNKSPAVVGASLRPFYSCLLFTSPDRKVRRPCAFILFLFFCLHYQSLSRKEAVSASFWPQLHLRPVGIATPAVVSNRCAVSRKKLYSHF